MMHSLGGLQSKSYKSELKVSNFPIYSLRRSKTSNMDDLFPRGCVEKLNFFYFELKKVQK